MPETDQGPSGRPLTYLQRRLHCRVPLSAAHRLSPVRHDVPAGPAAVDRGTADTEDVIVVGCGWTSDAKRAAAKFQPKLEPGVGPTGVRVVESYLPAPQTTDVVERPRHHVLTAQRISRLGGAELSRAAPSDFDKSTAVHDVAGVPRIQPRTTPELTQTTNNAPVVKRGRGRPRKYPSKGTANKQPAKSTLPKNAVTTAKVPPVQDPASEATRNRLIHDKENISPRSSVVAVSKRSAKQLDRNVWTSNAVRDASAYTSKLLSTSGLMANKVGLHERQKLGELPVNVILSDNNNNFPEKPTEKTTPNFRLKDFDKDKLLSMWSALKGTLQSDDWDAVNRKDQIGDEIKCQTTQQRGAVTEVAGEKREEKIENGTALHQKRPNEVLQTPALDAEPYAVTDISCGQSSAKAVHWKCPEVDVRRPDHKIPNSEFSDEPLPKTTSPFVEDFDDKLPLSESLGKPLFASTPIKLSDVCTLAHGAKIPGKRARVRFRPVTQAGNDDEEDASDRVELSKLAALPSMHHSAASNATQISGVRPADIVRAFRTIDNVAAATSKLAQPTHGVPPTLPFAAVTTVPSQSNIRPVAADVQQSSAEKTANAVHLEQSTVVVAASSPATATTPSSVDVSPLPSEIVPGQLLHFYGAYYDGPPYNLSPSTGGFVTKAARKRPIVDNLDAPERKRFQPDVPSNQAPAVNAAGDGLAAPAFARQPAVATAVPLQPEMSRPAAAGSSHCRRAAEPEVTSGNAVRDVRRAPNGVPLHDLLRLQRNLSTVGDPATLRRVVQIIGETGRYCVNDVTFDFDLCNLDSATVMRLIQCLDAAAVGPAAAV